MKFRLMILALWMLAFNSCKKENMCDCFKSNGPDNVIYRDVKDFNCIFLKDKMDVYLTQGPEFEVKVEAGANLQKLIKIQLDGETLNVFNTNRCNWVRGYKRAIKVYITAPYFKYIRHGGLGTIESVGTITQNELHLRVENSGDFKIDVNTTRVICSAHGNGDTYLTGVTQILEDDYTGTNYLYAYGLTVSNYIYLHSVSIGHAYVNAPENGTMDIGIDRAGNVYYRGNPATINLQKKSKGKLIRD